ncbi:hypothetical protein VFPPC_18117 [Pochonia chlamydosporia 170]|uniref:Uncharacterized protein n=1 Tax=Pochonia chlamydosporia 170 TaxID=1380566 RepID=A0A219AQW3_METCM|nr:hypothetical protein VFPPC_18117 [Pochonia chlamydosporia 170]OWT42704.1 hypothetical protein VFPPC_18117 [Pochonia chlamydosporia 170]
MAHDSASACWTLPSGAPQAVGLSWVFMDRLCLDDKTLNRYLTQTAGYRTGSGSVIGSFLSGSGITVILSVLALTQVLVALRCFGLLSPGLDMQAGKNENPGAISARATIKA